MKENGYYTNGISSLQYILKLNAIVLRIAIILFNTIKIHIKLQK